MLAGQEEEKTGSWTVRHIGNRRETGSSITFTKYFETVTKDMENCTYTHCLQVVITPLEGGS